MCRTTTWSKEIVNIRVKESKCVENSEPVSLSLFLSLPHWQTKPCRCKPSSSFTFSLAKSPVPSFRCILLVKRWKVFLILYGQKYHSCTTKFLYPVVRLSIYVTHFPFSANIWYTIYQLLCFYYSLYSFSQCHTVLPFLYRLSFPFLPHSNLSHIPSFSFQN